MSDIKTVIVTGGAGFIGSAVIRHLIADTDATVINLDKLTYAANPAAVAVLEGRDDYTFIKADICDRDTIRAIFEQQRPDAVLHLAAESHVDRSIDAPDAFIQSNIVGTYELLQAAYVYWRELPPKAKQAFRYLHVSTDEVYGDIEGDEDLFVETTPYAPSSPYSASKAGSDHLVRAWHRTYGLPVVVTNCSDNYGPYHFPDKPIPPVILNAIHGKPLPR